MKNIPQEYLAFRNENDFGFSAIDEGEVKHVTDEDTLETKFIREKTMASAEGVQRLEEKIDRLLTLYDEGKLGLDVEKEKLVSEVKSKLIEVEQLILPLLVNLMKNPDKEYIYWPNRQDKIQEQIDRIVAITRE
jgi:hypothetical protein